MMDDFTVDEVKYIKCTICGKDVPVNVNYPIDQVTCTRCYLEKKWQRQEKEAHLDEHSY